MRIPLGVLLGLALSVSGPLGAQSLPLEPVDRIVAVVDEDVVLRSELDVAVGNIVERFRQNPEQLPPANVLERQVLERLVMIKLQVDRASGTGVRISEAELEQSIAAVAGQQGMSVAQLRQQLAADGIPFDEFRNSVREELLIQRLRQRVTQSRVVVSEAEIDMALETSPLQSEELRLAHILVALPENPTPEQIETARTKIEGVKQLIDRGEMDFTAAAIRYSDSPNALEGGDLGWRSADEIPPLFINVVKAMQPGEITDPIRGPTGLQLLTVLERRQAGAQQVTQYRASHLMIRTSEIVDSEQARAKVDVLRRRIEAGEPFADVAKTESDDTATRALGGDMGWFEANEWGTSVGAVVASLADGELSQPFQSELGWHLIQRVGERMEDTTVANQRNRARETIGRRKADEEYERFLRQIRAEAFVDMRLGS
ncbi:MAG TPA: molecular chaperone SurA [Xanthomonadales bacterium]|nr:molecular chaperone SurA [Xanthomonadales bacterium]